MASPGGLKRETFRPQVKELEVDRAAELVDFIAETAGDLSPLELVELGSVYVDDERAMNPSRKLSPGNLVRVHASPRRFAVPTDLAARVTEETSDRLVVEKPSGLPTEPTVDNFRENLASALSDLRGQRLYVVNSLETESSGLVMLAKSLESQAALKRDFAESRVRRRFVAFTAREVRPADYPGFTVRYCEELISATDIVSAGRVSWKIEGASLALAYKLEIETMGRPSGVREGLASLDSPILGDVKNGSSVRLLDMESGRSAIALHQTSF